jgi:peptidoglycan/xylan/chitin deacetylase (PgdA/CDA1 family)
VLQALAAENVKATFFLEGERLFNNTERMKIAKKTYDQGHEIGSHTYTHRSLGDSGHGKRTAVAKPMTYPELLVELYYADLAIHEAIGKHVRLLRPPYLEYNAEAMAMMETMGIVPVSVNLDTDDWRYEKEAPASHVLRFQWALKNTLYEESWIHLQHDIYANVRSRPCCRGGVNF